MLRALLFALALFSGAPAFAQVQPFDDAQGNRYTGYVPMCWNGTAFAACSSPNPQPVVEQSYIVTPPGTSAPLGVPVQYMNGGIGVPGADAGNTSLGTGSGTCSATCSGTDMIASTDTSGYGGGQIVISITTFSGSATLTPAASNNNSTFDGTPDCWQENAGDQIITTITAAGVYICNIDERYFRLRWTVYGSGTQTGFWVMRPNPYQPSPSVVPVVSAIAEASHVFKAAAGNLLRAHAVNATATAGFCLIINATVAPTTGSTVTPLDFRVLPASGDCDFTYTPQANVRFGTGITFLVSSNASPFTFTSGTITAAISGLVK